MKKRQKTILQWNRACSFILLLHPTCTCSLFDMPKINGKLSGRQGKRKRKRKSEFILHVEHTFLLAYQNYIFISEFLSHIIIKLVLLLCLFFKTLHILGYWICSMIYTYVCECISGMLFRLFLCWMSVPLMMKYTNTHAFAFYGNNDVQSTGWVTI